MKTLFYSLLATLLLATTSDVQAQKIDYDKKNEQITVNGVPIAVMRRQPGGAPGLPDFSVRSLRDGRELIYLKGFGIEAAGSNWVWYEFNFIESGARCEVEMTNLQFGQRLATIIAERGLIRDGTIDNAAVNTFLNLYNRPAFQVYRQPPPPQQVVVVQQPAPQQVVVQQPAPRPGVNINVAVPGIGISVTGVEPVMDGQYYEETNHHYHATTRTTTVTGGRNRSARVVIAGNNIQQDQVMIGTYARQSSGAGMAQAITYQFFDPAGVMIATAGVSTVGAEGMMTITAADGSSSTFTVGSTERSHIEAAAMFLAERMYW